MISTQGQRRCTSALRAASYQGARNHELAFEGLEDLRLIDLVTPVLLLVHAVAPGLRSTDVTRIPLLLFVRL